MTALAKQGTREVARPLKVLGKLIRDDIEQGDKAGMDYYQAAGEKLNEAREGHFENDASGFWRWVEKENNFGKSNSQLRVWMALGAHKTPKRFKTLEQVEVDKGWRSTGRNYARRSWTQPVDDIAEKARNEARRLAAEDELTRQEEREAEAKLGMRLIDIGYRVLAKELHPDKGGSREAMARLGRVRDRLRSNV